MVGSWVGASHYQKDQVMVRSLELSTPLLFSGEPGGAGNGVNNQSFPHKASPIKIPLAGESPGSRARGGVKRVACPEMQWKFFLLPHTWPCESLPPGYSSVTSFHNKPVVQERTCFLSSVSCSIKLMEHRRCHGNLQLITSWSGTEIT